MKLLPKSEWKSPSATFNSDGSAVVIAGSADSDGDVIATGIIVGILSRKDREYVASFSVSFCLRIDFLK